LPDGIFSNQKSQLGSILQGLEMENVGIFNGHLEYIKSMWYILWPLDNLVVIWYIFHHFGILYSEPSGNPACEPSKRALNFLTATLKQMSKKIVPPFYPEIATPSFWR
jgi:hypothetical protein